MLAVETLGLNVVIVNNMSENDNMKCHAESGYASTSCQTLPSR